MKLGKRDRKAFQIAKDIASHSDFKTFHVGCVLVYRNHVIGAASNSTKTHPLQKRYNKKYRTFKKGKKPILDSLHAEIAALASVEYTVDQSVNWKDVKVYVYRICKGKKTGKGMARPCPSCLAALKDKGIRKIYYTTEEGFCMEVLN